MRVAIVGGKLQGIEAVYLAHKAGWEVFLIDTNPGVPASGMCDFFIPMDIVEQYLFFVLYAYQDCQKSSYFEKVYWYFGFFASCH